MMVASISGAPGFPILLQDFFCKRLIHQRNASTRTVQSYRDAFRLLLRYAEKKLGKPPTSLVLGDLDALLILGFLEHLESDRGNSIRTRNARLAAIRSFLHYASLCDPGSLPSIQCVLAIPKKRHDRPVLTYLSREEVEALVTAPDPSTWSGARDRVLFETMYNTGARVSEIIGLTSEDVRLDRSACVKFKGKGRKERTVPLWKKTTRNLSAWMRRLDLGENGPVFPNRKSSAMTRSGVAKRMQRAVSSASDSCPSLRNRRISPHTLRHTTAMHLLQAGVDLSVIAMWLGHESPSTTHGYMEADLAMKERALSQVEAPRSGKLRFRASDRLLNFLDRL